MAESCGCQKSETAPQSVDLSWLLQEQPPVDLTPGMRKLGGGGEDMTPRLRKLPAGAEDLTPRMRKTRRSRSKAGAGGPPAVGAPSRLPPAKMAPGSVQQSSDSALDCDALCTKQTSDPIEWMDCVRECREEELEANNGGAGTSSSCPTGSGYFELPDFQKVDWETQLCFLVEYGELGWPETDCCPPKVNAVNNCDPPSASEWFKMLLKVPVHELNTRVDRQSDKIEPASEITAYDKQILGAGLAVLEQNMDIVMWAVCLVQEWSPEVQGLDLVGCIQRLFSVEGNGTYSWTVTYVTNKAVLETQTMGPHMWAFTELDRKDLPDPKPNEGNDGLVVPVGSGTRWEWWVERWREGGKTAFCAAVQVAETILHEMIHICGDNYNNEFGSEKYERDTQRYGYAEATNQPGTLHDNYCYYNTATGEVLTCPYDYPFTCWDEARMVATIFLWAMAQRHTCLGERNFPGRKNCCDNVGDPRYFAYSVSTGDMISVPEC